MTTEDDTTKFNNLLKQARDLEQEAAVLNARLEDAQKNLGEHNELLVKKYGTNNMDELIILLEELKQRQSKLLAEITTAIESVEVKQ